MGWKSAFAYDRPADIYREHARLSTYRNNGRRLFDIGRHGAISNPDYDALEPFCWGDSPFADGHFPTGDGRSEEHTSELQSLMRISYAVFCLKKKKHTIISTIQLAIHNNQIIIGNSYPHQPNKKYHTH